MALEGEMMAWLETERGDRIPVTGLCTFGRTTGHTVVLPTHKVSRRHAMIHEQGGEFWVVDLGSTNGVQINDHRITHPVPLRAGDVIQMPSTRFTFRQVLKQVIVAEPSQNTQSTQNQITTPDIRIENCWIFLADIQGFSKMSQQLPVEQLAPMVGKWVAQCQELLQKHRGKLAKFLGDGFMAYWTSTAGEPSLIASACQEFRVLQESTPLPFRVVLHYGEVSFGGNSPDASNTMIGPELNFAFRLEKVASLLGLRWIFSEAAARNLREHLLLSPCGAHKIPDFESDRPCFTLGA